MYRVVAAQEHPSWNDDPQALHFNPQVPSQGDDIKAWIEIIEIEIESTSISLIKTFERPCLPLGGSRQERPIEVDYSRSL